MDAVNSFFSWLFGTRAGVLALIVGGVLISVVVAWLLEKRTRAQFYNHEKGPDDWDLFGDDDE